MKIKEWTEYINNENNWYEKWNDKDFIILLLKIAEIGEGFSSMKVDVGLDLRPLSPYSMDVFNEKIARVSWDEHDYRYV